MENLSDLANRYQTLALDELFAADHQRCDNAWAEVEAALEKNNLNALARAWQRFDERTRAHLAMEEDVLFSAFERSTGITQGPTRIMAIEHEQMRALLSGIANQVATGNVLAVSNQGDTLLMLTQQHNQKEEAMLYPMATCALQNEWPTLRAQLARYLA